MHWCKLCCWFKGTAGSIFLHCTTSVDNAIPRDAGDREDPPPSPPVSYTGSIHIICASVQHQHTEKKLSQFQPSSYSLFYLSLGIFLTSFTSLGCSPSLRSLALWVVTAAPHVTHAVTHLPLLTHAPPSVAAKNLKSTEHFSAI